MSTADRSAAFCKLALAPGWEGKLTPEELVACGDNEAAKQKLWADRLTGWAIAQNEYLQLWKTKIQLGYAAPGFVTEVTKSLAAPPVEKSSPASASTRAGSRWRSLEREFLGRNPDCALCDAQAIVAHHVVPVSVDPARELDPDNLLAVCADCHFRRCHLGNWRTHDPEIAQKAREPAACVLVFAATSDGKLEVRESFLPQGGEAGHSRRAHTAEIAGSNPAPATPSREARP